MESPRTITRGGPPDFGKANAVPRWDLWGGRSRLSPRGGGVGGRGGREPGEEGDDGTGNTGEGSPRPGRGRGPGIPRKVHPHAGGSPRRFASPSELLELLQAR